MDSRKKDIFVFMVFMIMFVISAVMLITTGWLVDAYGIDGGTVFWNHEALWFSLISSFVAVSVLGIKLYNRYHAPGDRFPMPCLILMICIIIFNCISLVCSFRYILGLTESYQSEAEMSAAGGAGAAEVSCIMR